MYDMGPPPLLPPLTLVARRRQVFLYMVAPTLAWSVYHLLSGFSSQLRRFLKTLRTQAVAHGQLQC